MKNEFKILCTAISYYTRIPLYNFSDFSQESLKKSNSYFPFIGWIVGGFTALVFVMASMVFPKSIAVLLSILSGILLTGAFHEDGLSDSVDGFGGGYTKERILTIMKDSRIGTFGAIALFSALALKFALLYEIDTALLPIIIVAGHSTSRFFALTFIVTHEYARQNDNTSRSGIVSQKLNYSELIIPALFGVLPLFLIGFRYFITLIPLVIARQFIGSYLTKKIDGFTGDTLGASQQVFEIVFYLSAYLLITWTFI